MQSPLCNSQNRNLVQCVSRYMVQEKSCKTVVVPRAPHVKNGEVEAGSKPILVLAAVVLCPSRLGPLLLGCWRCLLLLGPILMTVQMI